MYKLVPSAKPVYETKHKDHSMLYIEGVPQILDKPNLFKFSYDSFGFWLKSIFTITPVASKNDNRIKSGQKWLKIRFVNLNPWHILHIWHFNETLFPSVMRDIIYYYLRYLGFGLWYNL